MNKEHEERTALIFQSYCENHISFLYLYFIIICSLIFLFFYPLVKPNTEMLSILLYFVHTLSDDESYWVYIILLSLLLFIYIVI